MRLSDYDQWKLDCGPDERPSVEDDYSDVDLDPDDDGPNPDDERDEALDREYDLQDNWRDKYAEDGDE